MVGFAFLSQREGGSKWVFAKIAGIRTMRPSPGCCQLKKMNETTEGSSLFFIQAAFVVPFGAGAFAFGFKLEHAFAAFQFNVWRITITFFELFFGQHLRKAAPALGAGGFDVVAFVTHE
jgi:hypothetical protein